MNLGICEWCDDEGTVDVPIFYHSTEQGDVRLCCANCLVEQGTHVLVAKESLAGLEELTNHQVTTVNEEIYTEIGDQLADEDGPYGRENKIMGQSSGLVRLSDLKKLKEGGE